MPKIILICLLFSISIFLFIDADTFSLYQADSITGREYGCYTEIENLIGIKSPSIIRSIEFFGAITEFRGAQPLKIAVGENTTMVEWHYDYTHKDWGVRKYNQVAVQEWKNGQIINERFYYGS